MTQFGVVLFYTTSAVMRAEKMLVRKGSSIKLIPTPRQFSSDCGIALQFEWNDLDPVKLVLDEAQIEYDSIRSLGANSV